MFRLDCFSLATTFVTNDIGVLPPLKSLLGNVANDTVTSTLRHYPWGLNQLSTWAPREPSELDGLEWFFFIFFGRKGEGGGGA